MIDESLPKSWQELQFGVQRIFRNVGMRAEVEVEVNTPRGTVNVDVLAVDVRSVDNIRYIVECKNWGSAIPQSVVHSFMTVMNETGGNIGFIISKHGLQKGAKQYTNNTNIIGMTYLEFQERYFEAWWKRYFCPRIGDAADRVVQYTEEINTVRDIAYKNLSCQDQEKFDLLRQRNGGTLMIMSMFNLNSLSPSYSVGKLLDVPKNLDDFKVNILAKIAPHIEWHCSTFRGLLEIILEYIEDVGKDFEEIFGGTIFENRADVSGVTVHGPVLEDRIYIS